MSFGRYILRSIQYYRAQGSSKLCMHIVMYIIKYIKMKPQQGDTKNICVYTLYTTLTMREVLLMPW